MENTVQQSGFEKYPAYKDSGVEWIGVIPEHWEIEKGKWLFLKNERPVRKNDEIVTCFRDGEVTLRSNRRTDGFTNALKEHGYQGIRKGDLVIHAMDAFAGSIGVSDSDGKSTPVYSACTERFPNTVNQYYYAYFLRSLALNGVILSLAKGIRERSTDFRFGDFGELLLSLPPLSEQTAIADFLDKKTAQIDQAIAQKERMIELLKERKQIIIQNAVTGKLRIENVLVDNALVDNGELIVDNGELTVDNGEWRMENGEWRMKDSGVEWIGEIPEHWEVKKLKYILNERNDTSTTGEETLFMMSQIHGLVVRSEYHTKAEVAQTTIGNKIVYENDLVFNKLKAHLGVFFKSTIEKKGLVSPDYAVYTSKGVIEDLKYLELLFRGPNYISQFIIKATGIVEGLIRLYTDDLFSISIPVPPIPEQSEILKFISNFSKKIEKAITLQQTQIEKLKEYKATLIDSAVTGKIRVFN